MCARSEERKSLRKVRLEIRRRGMVKGKEKVRIGDVSGQGVRRGKR